MKNRIDRYIQERNENDIRTAFNGSKTKTEILKKLGFEYNNGTTNRFLNECISRFELNIDHLDPKHNQRIYKKIVKECPVCGEEFEAQEGHPKEKMTCSYGCANIYFRSGENNGQHKCGKGKSPRSSYRYICFKHHEKKCIICGESNIVEVHHYDEDHMNHNPDNLVPLCSTHHKYMHSRFKELIEDSVDEYVKNFKLNKASSR